MSPVDRIARLKREKGKALVRAMYLAEFQAAAAIRAVALDKANDQLDRIARALPDALNAGLSLAEIARSAGVSRQTLYELKPRYDPSGDVHLAVLQTIATRQPISVQELAQQLNRSVGDVDLVVEGFVAGGLVDLAMAPGNEDEGDCLYLNDAGSSYLADWWVERDQDGKDG